MALCTIALLSACGSGDDQPTSQPTSQPASPSGPATVSGIGLRLLLDFEDLAPGPLVEGATLRDASGWDNAVVVRYPESPDVRVEAVDDPDRGAVVAFPGPCSADDPSCLRGVIDVESTVSLDVGDADFSYGARVKLVLDDLRDGANVVQKGYSTGGSGQWKLQVDDRAGRPQCVLVGSGTGEAQTVKSGLSVADGGWHLVECVRDHQGLSIVIDGQREGRTETASRVIISNPNPIRVGGKHSKRGSDPFFGQVDDVFLRIG